MAACRLIVHADDFGLTKKINEGVINAYQNGVLTSTSIMANGGAFEHAVKLYRDVPDLDLGVHLTLVEEKPILPPEKISTLVDSVGSFASNALIFTRHYLLGKIAPDDVRLELEAQIVKVKDCGLPVSHLDSHQHLHMLPEINRITFDLAKRHGVTAIRIPREKPRLYMLREPKSLLRLMQLLVLNSLCSRSLTDSLASTDSFLGFFDGGKLFKSKLQSLLKHLPKNGICELMCHPGAEDPENEYQHWNYNQAEELLALCDPEIKSWLENHKVNLISYRELFGAT